LMKHKRNINACQPIKMSSKNYFEKSKFILKEKFLSPLAINENSLQRF